MGVVNPITDRDILEKMKSYLEKRNFRNYLIFRVGLNLGLSVQDLLHLRIEDVLNKDFFTCQSCQIQISKSLQEEIQGHIGSQKKGYLFVSSSGKPLSRFQLYIILQNAAKAVGYKESIGAITFRKTFAYWAYREKLVDLPLLSKYLNHHTVEYTLNYLGIDGNEDSSKILESADL